MPPNPTLILQIKNIDLFLILNNNYNHWPMSK